MFGFWGTRMISPVSRTRGFTLIEIAIVLVVIGLLLSGGLLGIAPVLQSSRVTETNSKLDLIENALILYALRNSCLPCPATGNLLSSNANVGLAVDKYTRRLSGRLRHRHMHKQRSGCCAMAQSWTFCRGRR